MGEELSRVLRAFTAPAKLEVLRLLWKYEDGLSRKELHRLIDRHRSRIDHVVQFLKKLGVVDWNRELRRYILTDSGRKVFLAIKYIEECVNNAKNKKSKTRKNIKGHAKRKT